MRYSRETNGAAYGANTLTPTQAQGFNDNTYNAGIVNLTSTLSPTLINQMTFGAHYMEKQPPAKLRWPDTFLSQWSNLGQGTAFPQSTSLKKFQLRDTIGFSLAGRTTHNIKTGVEYVFTPHVGANYTTQTTPQYYFLRKPRLRLPIPDQIFYNIGSGVFQTNNLHRLGAFIQDDWQTSRRLTLNLGLRWDYYAGVAFNQNYSPTYRFLQSVLPLSTESR